MNVDEVLERTECFIYQLFELQHIPDDIKAIINDPLPGRQVAPWEHNHTSVEASEDINS